MQDRINVGIIGTGSMGLIRKAIAEKHPALNLVALSDAHRPNIPRTENYSYYEDYRNSSIPVSMRSLSLPRINTGRGS